MERDLCSLLVEALRAMVANDFSTELIVAGYGAGDNYPSVVSINIAGYLKGTLKYSRVASRARIGCSESGHAVSFAQNDVVERLLSGGRDLYREDRRFSVPGGGAIGPAHPRGLRAENQKKAAAE